MTRIVRRSLHGKGALVALTAVAAPVALAFETLLRAALFPEDFELVREILRPAMTVVAWALVAVCAIAALIGAWVQQRVAVRAVSRIPEHARTPERVARAHLGSFMLAASIPQVPAVLATIAFMFGASLLPVIAAVAVVTIGVGVQAWRAR